MVFYQTEPCLAAIAYAGKSTKAAWHYRFTQSAQLPERIKSFFAGLKAQAKEKAKRASEKAAYDATKEFRPGDVVVNTWGWEQTNQDFYIVHKATVKSLVLSPIDQELAENPLSDARVLASDIGEFLGVNAPKDWRVPL